jgi:hypothetical protein
MADFRTLSVDCRDTTIIIGALHSPRPLHAVRQSRGTRTNDTRQARGAAPLLLDQQA